MATQAKLEVGIWRDTLEARDVAIMTPHFKVVSASPDWDALCDDLATAINTWQAVPAQVRVRAYDDEGSPPRAPIGEAFKSKGLAPVSTMNRDIAVCLSFSGGSGRATERGRLYVPCYVTGIAASAAVASVTMLQKCADLVPILTGLGGVNVDWVVWSSKLRSSKPVERWYVDNAFDTQRRRGIKATARQSGTTTEEQTPNIVQLGVPLDSETRAAVEASGSDGG